MYNFIDQLKEVQSLLLEEIAPRQREMSAIVDRGAQTRSEVELAQSILAIAISETAKLAAVENGDYAQSPQSPCLDQTFYDLCMVARNAFRRHSVQQAASIHVLHSAVPGPISSSLRYHLACSIGESLHDVLRILASGPSKANDRHAIFDCFLLVLIMLHERHTATWGNN